MDDKDNNFLTKIMKKEDLWKILLDKPIFRKLVENIADYVNEEFGRKLTYSPVKSEKRFRRNYKLHDKALKYVSRLLEEKGFHVIPLGKDLRDHRVQMENEMPDLLIINRNKIFSLDIKSKTSDKWFGMINERAVLGYRKFKDQVSTNSYQIPIYAQFVLMENFQPTNTLGYSNLSEVHKREGEVWDKNNVYIFNWKEGLIV